MIDVSARAHADDFPLADTDEFDNGRSANLRARVKRELEPGERLLWAARCDPRDSPRTVGFYVVRMITVCLLGLGLLLIMPPRFLRHWNDGSAFVMGLGFLAIAGLSLMSMLANWNSRRTERRRLIDTCYAVTDRRAIIWTPANDDAIRIRTLPRGAVKNLARVERPDGSGHLDFSDVPEGLELDYYYRRFQFSDIPEVRRVEQIVRNNLMTRDATE